LTCKQQTEKHTDPSYDENNTMNAPKLGKVT